MNVQQNSRKYTISRNLLTRILKKEKHDIENYRAACNNNEDVLLRVKAFEAFKKEHRWFEAQEEYKSTLLVLKNIYSVTTKTIVNTMISKRTVNFVDFYSNKRSTMESDCSIIQILLYPGTFVFQLIRTREPLLHLQIGSRILERRVYLVSN